MSEIRSQATPTRDELDEKIQRWLTSADKIASTGFSHQKVRLCESMGFDWHETIAALQKALPRTVNSATDLKALPKCSLIRGLEREGQRSGDVFEKVGPDHWLCLDPGDRFDGEETTPSHAIILIYKAGIRVLFTPGDAG
ncbi:hypothetical protein LRQ08_21610 [Rhodococcus qingshengii]|uniref:hypothetical protein n=1 Tax=Rhodococcus qingshengii TaxID=334542 RepID=UPI00211275C5|nr:hypothetical protein [Rhodococcus qingshengii]UUE23826.1 hypothetical protein LRQ08_21610 [Rhodococcus qingshengii]